MTRLSDAVMAILIVVDLEKSLQLHVPECK